MREIGEDPLGGSALPLAQAAPMEQQLDRIAIAVHPHFEKLGFPVTVEANGKQTVELKAIDVEKHQ